ncbi:MAG: heavy-metal-associated domain-containing protein [Eggerthellaceae bacterium]|nr:heavy-metal-associated domain-containing protein [Eggerthellaceae bacterium]
MYKTTVKIDGMMCGHCEAHVNDAIRASFDVDKVNSSHSQGETVIIAEEALAEDAIKDALKDTGYAVLGVSSELYEKKGLFGGGAR